jgi:hypothetical protein
VGAARAGRPNLLKLFNKLGPWLQNESVRAVELDRDTFSSELAKMSDAFEKWRYVYEYEHDELQINLGFMDKLAKATPSAAHNAVGA